MEALYAWVAQPYLLGKVKVLNSESTAASNAELNDVIWFHAWEGGGNFNLCTTWGYCIMNLLHIPKNPVCKLPQKSSEHTTLPSFREIPLCGPT